MNYPSINSSKLRSRIRALYWWWSKLYKSLQLLFSLSFCSEVSGRYLCCYLLQSRRRSCRALCKTSSVVRPGLQWLQSAMSCDVFHARTTRSAAFLTPAATLLLRVFSSSAYRGEERAFESFCENNCSPA